MNVIKRLWEERSAIRYLYQTIYFNFHYLPFKHAIKLPIYVHKMKMHSMRGTISIEAERVYRGMVRLGFHDVSLYPNNGIVWDNHGGRVVFRGTCAIGNDSYISIGKHATIEFGDKFVASASWRCVSFRGITFGEAVRFGWECLIFDTNFHPLFDIEKQQFRKASSPIIIGAHNWFGAQCKIMHGTVTPERCIFSLGTIVTRHCEKESYCVMGGNPVKVLTRNVMRIIDQDDEE